MNTTPHPQAPQPNSNATATRNSWIFVIGSVVVIGLIIWGIVALLGLRNGNDNEILKNGVATEGISSAQVYKGPEKTGRRAVTTVYHAYYRYTVNDENYSVIGEKDYKSADNIHAGMKATVVYLPEDPEEAVVTNEE